MAIGLKLQIGNSVANTTETVVFGQFPVRIGRNPLNDLKLQAGFVSQFHAVLDFRNGSLTLRDLGSKNGTTLRCGRAPAHESVDLAPYDGEFSISALLFKAAVEEVGDVVPPRAPQRGLLLGGLGAHHAPLDATVACSDQDAAWMLKAVAKSFASQKIGGTEALRSRIDAYKTSRATMQEIVQTIAVEVQSVPEYQRQSLFAWAFENYPGIADDPGFRRLAEHHSAIIDKHDADGRVRRLEHIALQAVRELASLYDPTSSSLGTEEDLVQFLTRVRDTLDMFFKSFIPLRDGHRQFMAEMDIPNPTSCMPGAPEGAAGLVSRATTPLALAKLLLGSSASQHAVCRAMEGAFADLMIHQIALLSGVMRGVRSLMQEVAPSTIESDMGNRRKKGATGLMVGPYRFRELWKVFVSRYADVTESEKQMYSHVFGSDFVHGYAQLSEDAPPQRMSRTSEVEPSAFRGGGR